eukprot:CAMPEP_0182910146 /NCGR_PEP_ID=MMETSP0034_2-20130328/36136_1 /TAXON_ID=156128 /ORGANISM="Nephroselmis pyriformis, Strain CCMP717" /LENGTH=1185 /DNA_ID=CAMNT_0025046447 /DNA_START=31 /DNA_END=3588 /DNA_ORIENTATION=+
MNNNVAMGAGKARAASKAPSTRSSFVAGARISQAARRMPDAPSRTIGVVTNIAAPERPTKGGSDGRADAKTKVFEHDLSQGTLFLGLCSTATEDAPGNGGLRVRSYDSDDSARQECQNLAEAMTRKHRVYKTGFSGAKLVFNSSVAIEDIDKENLMSEVAEVLHEFDGLAYTGCDMNISMDDMELLDSLSPYVLAGLGSDVDTNIATARGAFAAVVKTVERLGLPVDFKILVQGVGNVGSDLAECLVKYGATVYTMDFFPERADIPGATNISHYTEEQWSTLDIDVFSPNAAAGVITPAVAKALKCKAVVGAANVPFSCKDAQRTTAERGIIFVPEYITSAGAIIVDSLEWKYDGYSGLRPSQVYRFVYEQVYAKVADYLEELSDAGPEKGQWAEHTDSVSDGWHESRPAVGSTMDGWEQERNEEADVVIIGGGMAGTATAYQLGKLEPGMKGIVLEAGPGVAHPKGSSYGESRMFRQMYSDPYFSSLQAQALEMWHELESESGEKLLDMNGLLFYGQSDTGETVEGSIPGAQKVMQEREIPHEYFDGGDNLKERFPMDAEDGHVGILEASAGSVNSSKACEAMMAEAVATDKWELRANSQVVDMWREEATGRYLVSTSEGRVVSAKKVVIAAGAWTNDILAHLGGKVETEVWGVHWGHAQLKKGAETPQWFHFGEEEELIYGFPEADGKAKVGADFSPDRHKYQNMDEFEYETDEGVVKQMKGFLEEQWNGVYDLDQGLDMNVSPYSMTKDAMFILDTLPGHPDVSVFTGGNGRAFKFAPILGRALADLVRGADPVFDVARMAVTRDGIYSEAESDDGEKEGAFGRAHVPFGAEGEALYSKLTLGCFDVIQNAKDLVLAGVADLKLDGGMEGSIRLADFGSADGGPEMPLVHQIKDVLPKECDLEVCFEDQPNNDFKSLFYLANGVAESPVPFQPLSERPGVYFSGVGRGFFDQCFPRESVDIATSFTAMHWLSEWPGAFPDAVHHTTSPGGDPAMTAAYAAQADKDWRTILDQRAKELKKGGSMTVVVFGVDPEKKRTLGYSAKEGEACMYEELDACWKEMKDDGYITDAEYKAVSFCNYYRTEKELRAPFEDNSLPLNIKTLEWRETPCPFGRGKGSPADVVGTVRTWSNSTFLSALDESRPESERKALVDAHYGKYLARIEANPMAHHMDYWHVYMRFEKI